MAILQERRAYRAIEAPSRALRYLPATAFALDAAIIVGCSITAVIVRTQWDLFEQQPDVDSTVGAFSIITVVAWLITIAVYRGYSRDVFIAGTDEYKRVMRATLLVFGVLGVACFLARLPLARGFFVLSVASGLPALILGRYMLRRAVHQAHRHGQLLSRVLIAGSGDHIDEIAGVIKREPWLGYDIVGALTPTGVETATPGGLPIIGATDEIEWQVISARPDVVFFAGGAVESAKELGHLAWELGRDGVQLVVAPSVTEVSRERVRIRPVGGLPLIHVDAPQATPFSRTAKRTFDIVGALAGIFFFAPIMLFAAVWIRAADGGPALFQQIRVGKNGHFFPIMKFRSMVTNAEELLAELHESSGYDGGLFKLEDDPRVTRPGRFLRRHSLDELPQLFNVLKGDMSLVGPRPPLPAEVKQYERHVERRLDVRPGLTGCGRCPDAPS